MLEDSSRKESASNRFGSRGKKMGEHEGNMLANRFQIMELINDGISSWLYKAIDSTNGDKVAAKILKRSQLSNERVRQRMLQEAEVVKTLSHQNLVEFYDNGETPAGEPYIVMEFIGGKSLREVIDRNHDSLSLKRCLNIFKQAAEGLTHAHERGYLHRQISPDNIMVTEQQGKVLAKVVDFGSAKVTEYSKSAPLLKTMPGERLGTFGYMSPEQLWGKPIDARSDVYSLGCVMYEALTGVAPYLAELQGEHNAIPKPPSEHKDLPADVDEIVGKAMATNPADRYQIMPEFGVAIMALEDKLGMGQGAAICQKLLSYMQKLTGRNQ